MDALLIIFAFQLAILFVCLMYSIEGGKMPSRISLSGLSDLFARVFGAKDSRFASEIGIAENESLNADSESQNDKGVVYLDCGLAQDTPSHLSDDSEADCLDQDFEKSNSNELWSEGRFSFITRKLLKVLTSFGKSIRGLGPRVGRVRRFQPKSTQPTSGVFSTGNQNKAVREASNGRGVSSLSQLRLETQPGVLESLPLVYKNENLPDEVALHLKTKLVKLNFVIYKKKKTRPLPIIFELADEAF